MSTAATKLPLKMSLQLKLSLTSPENQHVAVESVLRIWQYMLISS
jgi:hypothetical protein